MFFLNIDKRLTKRERNYENEEIKKDEEYFNANK
jgi:deoxyadenosine/deoxycytidine kinase